MALWPDKGETGFGAPWAFPLTRQRLGNSQLFGWVS